MQARKFEWCNDYHVDFGAKFSGLIVMEKQLFSSFKEAIMCHIPLWAHWACDAIYHIKEAAWQIRPSGEREKNETLLTIDTSVANKS